MTTLSSDFISAPTGSTSGTGESFASPRFPSIVQCFFLRNYHFLSQLIFHHAAPLFFDRDTLDDKKGSVSFIDPKTVDIV